MCDKCYGYIYDVLMDPLSSTQLNNKTLRLYSRDIVKCFYKALNTYISDELIMDNFKVSMILYEHKNLENVLSHEFKEYQYDKWVWERFNLLFPKEMDELLHAIQICVDNNLVSTSTICDLDKENMDLNRKQIIKERYVLHYFMYKLRILLTLIPDIHKCHIHKQEYPVYKSPASVPHSKIVELRIRAGLPVDTDIDDLYY